MWQLAEKPISISQVFSSAFRLWAAGFKKVQPFAVICLLIVISPYYFYMNMHACENPCFLHCGVVG